MYFLRTLSNLKSWHFKLPTPFLPPSAASIINHSRKRISFNIFASSANNLRPGMKKEPSGAWKHKRSTINNNYCWSSLLSLSASAMLPHATPETSHNNKIYLMWWKNKIFPKCTFSTSLFLPIHVSVALNPCSECHETLREIRRERIYWIRVSTYIRHESS